MEKRRLWLRFRFPAHPRGMSEQGVHEPPNLSTIEQATDPSPSGWPSFVWSWTTSEETSPPLYYNALLREISAVPSAMTTGASKCFSDSNLPLLLQRFVAKRIGHSCLFPCWLPEVVSELVYQLQGPGTSGKGGEASRIKLEKKKKKRIRAIFTPTDQPSMRSGSTKQEAGIPPQ